MITKACGLKEKLLQQVEESYLSQEQKESVKQLITERIEILQSHQLN